MNLALIFQKSKRTGRRATVEDIRRVFGDYHNVLHWLATFLVGDEDLANACIVDACKVAERQTPVFHEWLIHWAARATVHCAFASQRECLSQQASAYESNDDNCEYPPLSVESLEWLVKNAGLIQTQLDTLCRFVLVLRGIAGDSCGQIASQLHIRQAAVERAYRAAFEALGQTSTSEGHPAPICISG